MAIWMKSIEGPARKVIDGSFLIWLLTGPGLFYAIMGLFLLAAVMYLYAHHTIGRRDAYGDKIR